MAVKMRLMRLGKKKQPVYRVVVADGRKPRDGRYIEAIGRYDARQEPSLIDIDNEKAVDWLSKGAQPTDPVRKLLEISGAWSAYKVSKGEIHTVPSARPAPAPEEAATEPEEAAADAAAPMAQAEDAAAAEATDELTEVEEAQAEAADVVDTAEAEETADDE